MKSFFCTIAILISLCSLAQPAPKMDTVVAKVYALANSKTISSDKSITVQDIFSGSGAVLADHRMRLVTLHKKAVMNYAPNTTVEQFFIIKTGPVQVLINESRLTTLDRGSVICVLPGDALRLINSSNDPVEVYEMSYVSKANINIERGKNAGNSFTMNWKDMVFKPHDKGGVRQLFDRQTAMLNRFDIHVTQLNEGFNSHAPHTHKNEEIILMLEGNAEMQIGDQHQKANPGDVVMLTSNIPHNLTNIGKNACLYFAIQWN